MALSLAKGGNVSLSAQPGLKHLLIGLGWDARASHGDDFDLDATAFLLDTAGRVRGDEGMIFYNQMVSACGSVRHGGDNRTGDGDGDDEVLKVDLETLPVTVDKLSLCVTIHDAEARKQNFGQVANAFIRVVDRDTDKEIVRFDLSEDYSVETAMVFGEIYRRGQEWKFRAVGQGQAGGLLALCNAYGVNAT